MCCCVFWEDDERSYFCLVFAASLGSFAAALFLLLCSLQFVFEAEFD